MRSSPNVTEWCPVGKTFLTLSKCVKMASKPQQFSTEETPLWKIRLPFTSTGGTQVNLLA